MRMNASQVHTKLNYACLSARFVIGQPRCLSGIVSLPFLIRGIELIECGE